MIQNHIRLQKHENGKKALKDKLKQEEVIADALARQ